MVSKTTLDMMSRVSTKQKTAHLDNPITSLIERPDKPSTFFKQIGKSHSITLENVKPQEKNLHLQPPPQQKPETQNSPISTKNHLDHVRRSNNNSPAGKLEASLINSVTNFQDLMPRAMESMEEVDRKSRSSSLHQLRAQEMQLIKSNLSPAKKEEKTPSTSKLIDAIMSGPQQETLKPVQPNYDFLPPEYIIPNALVYGGTTLRMQKNNGAKRFIETARDSITKIAHFDFLDKFQAEKIGLDSGDIHNFRFNFQGESASRNEEILKQKQLRIGIFSKKTNQNYIEHKYEGTGGIMNKLSKHRELSSKINKKILGEKALIITRSAAVTPKGTRMSPVNPKEVKGSGNVITGRCLSSMSQRSTSTNFTFNLDPGSTMRSVSVSQFKMALKPQKPGSAPGLKPEDSKSQLTSRAGLLEKQIEGRLLSPVNNVADNTLELIVQQRAGALNVDATNGVEKIPKVSPIHSRHRKLSN